MKATNEYVSTLFELKEATIAENIVWKRLNKDTYTYKVMNDDLEDLIITIKKISDKETIRIHQTIIQTPR